VTRQSKADGCGGMRTQLTNRTARFCCYALVAVLSDRLDVAARVEVLVLLSLLLGGCC